MASTHMQLQWVPKVSPLLPTHLVYSENKLTAGRLLEAYRTAPHGVLLTAGVWATQSGNITTWPQTPLLLLTRSAIWIAKMRSCMLLLLSLLRMLLLL